jgi:hypothetical protein
VCASRQLIGSILTATRSKTGVNIR